LALHRQHQIAIRSGRRRAIGPIPVDQARNHVVQVEAGLGLGDRFWRRLRRDDRFRFGFRLRLGRDFRLGLGFRLRLDRDDRLGLGFRLRLGRDDRLGLGLGFRLRLGRDFRLGLGFRLRLGRDDRLGFGFRLRLDRDDRLGLGLPLGYDFRLGLGSGHDFRLRLRLRLGLRLRLSHDDRLGLRLRLSHDDRLGLRLGLGRRLRGFRLGGVDLREGLGDLAQLGEQPRPRFAVDRQGGEFLIQRDRGAAALVDHPIDGARVEVELGEQALEFPGLLEAELGRPARGRLTQTEGGQEQGPQAVMTPRSHGAILGQIGPWGQRLPAYNSGAWPLQPVSRS
jgi:hypothetical protein